MSTTLRESLDAALADCVVIDCETTGLDPADARIIEIAALRVHDGVPVETFHTLVDPGVPLPREITALTGISPQQLVGKPSFADIVGDVTGFLGERTVVGHNVEFDISFINAEVRRSGSPTPPVVPTVVCTAESARRLIPRDRVGRYRLATLADVLGLAHRPSHRAVDDVLATADLLAFLGSLSR
ncbi:PolC-type DNA polymerase III [Corynebacterium sp.]|uniref:3'-5' exonuclease n=1 Tax=Corynebacterium sp. TaxID=1720 RepID=UPI003B3B280B